MVFEDEPGCHDHDEERHDHSDGDAAWWETVAVVVLVAV